MINSQIEEILILKFSVLNIAKVSSFNIEEKKKNLVVSSFSQEQCSYNSSILAWENQTKAINC